MSALSESLVEDAALEWLAGLGYAVGHGPDIGPEGSAPERDTTLRCCWPGGFAMLWSGSTEPWLAGTVRIRCDRGHPEAGGADRRLG